MNFEYVHLGCRLCSPSGWLNVDGSWQVVLARHRWAKSLPIKLGILPASRAATTDGLLVLGVHEPGYTPSKLYGYLLLGRPVLACFHRDSPAAADLEPDPGLAQWIRFGPGCEDPNVAARQLDIFLTAMEAGHRFERTETIRPYLAPAMAARHAELFDRCLASVPTCQQRSSP